MGLSDTLGIVATAVLSVGSAGAIMVGLAKYFGERVAERWLEGVKAGYAKELAHVQHELDRFERRYQAQLDHSVTVSRVQFEEEFRSVREVWKFVARARASAIGIVETKVHEDDNPEKQLERFFVARAAFAEDQRKLVLAVDNNSPFYPQDIYLAVDAFRTRTALEVSQLQTRKPFKDDWFDRREAAQRDILALAEIVSLAIRQRLAAIVIEEGEKRPLPDVTSIEAEQLPASSSD